MDPNPYHPKRLDAIKSIEKTNKFIALKNCVNFQKTLIDTEVKLPYLGLENVESNTGDYIGNFETKEFGTAVLFEQDDILFPKSKFRRS